MNFLIVDDEPNALKELEKQIRKIVPNAGITPSRLAKTALLAARTTSFDVAFLDIELGTSNGLLLAKQLKELLPNLRIIFVTGYSQYAIDAFAIHATGYLLKPVLASDIERELKFIYGDQISDSKRVRVKTFGNFSVLVDGKELVFKRQKSKELLAYLIERNGQSVNIHEACGILFEDTPYSRNMKNYFHTILSDLRNTLSSVSAEDILVKSYNSLSIDPGKIDCDYFRFLQGDPKAINEYRGEFMISYSWAEFSNAKLENSLRDY